MVSSSRPSWPWTTSARSVPLACRTWSHPLRHRRVGHPGDLAPDPSRVGQRTEDVEHRGTPSSRRVRHGVAHRGMEARGEAEADAGLLRRSGRRRPGRDRSPRRAPRAGRPRHRPTTPPGCRACTPGHPAPAMTIAARVDTLMLRAAVAAGADDVDHAVERPATAPYVALSIIAATRPVSSSTVSPFIRNATMNPAIWAEVAPRRGSRPWRPRPALRRDPHQR